MLKRTVSFVLIFSLIFGMASVSIGVEESSPKLLLNNNSVSLEQEIYLDELGQLMIPLRQVAEEMDYEVLWNNIEQSIELKNNLNTVKLQIGKSNVSLNDKEIILSTTPKLKNHKTFVPAEIFSKVLNSIVGWDSGQGILKFNKPKENTEDYFKVSDQKEIIIGLEDYMNKLEEKQNFHGTVLVARNDKLLLNKGYGYADFTQNTLNKPGTSFAIGSVTKQFTAMAIMQLVENGLINVADKVSKYLPKMPHGDLITIENLLTHTSGLANYTDVTNFFLIDSNDLVPMDMVDLIKDMPLEYTPGDGFKYSNTNYLILGIIIENITDMSLEEYLNKNIFTPLNMTSTGTTYGVKKNVHDATAYAGYLEVTPVDDSILLKKAYGAGNLYSTVEDLYRWDRGLNTEKIIKNETLDKIFHEYVDISDTASYGYGWMIENTEKGKEIFHGGNTLGFTSNIARYVEDDLTVIVLTNNGYYDVESITEDLSSIVLNKEYTMPVGNVEIQIEDYDIYNKYEGKYHFLQGTFLEIKRVEDKLFAQVTGQGAFQIYPRALDNFFAKIVDASIKFVEEDGEVDILVFKQLGLEIECYRAEPEEEKQVADIDPVVYEEYIGEYEMAPGVNLTITTSENKIFAQLTGQESFEIFPMSEIKYFYKVVDATITFDKNESGEVINLVLNQQGQDMPAQKIK